MHLSQREIDRALIFLVAEMARRRRAKGLKLNYPESVALIADEIMEAAREGASYEEALRRGEGVLLEDDVMEGVVELAAVVQFEAQFEDGTRLVTLQRPIRRAGKAASGRGEEPIGVVLDQTGQMGVKPGEVICPEEELLLNPGFVSKEVELRNDGTRPVWITSHMDLSCTNPALALDRDVLKGWRLDVPSGEALRVDPGETRRATAIKRAGNEVDSLEGAPATSEPKRTSGQ